MILIMVTFPLGNVFAPLITWTVVSDGTGMQLWEMTGKIVVARLLVLTCTA